jgi:hypothetical protein
LYQDVDCGQSLYLFPKYSLFRDSCYKLYKNKYFDNLILAFILLSSFKLATDSYNYRFDPTTGRAINYNSPYQFDTTLGGSTDSSPITVYYSSIANATSVSSLTQAGTGTLASNTSTVSVAIPGGNWYVYIRITSPNAAVGPIILSSFTIASSTATFYYPFVSHYKCNVPHSYTHP